MHVYLFVGSPQRWSYGKIDPKISGDGPSQPKLKVLVPFLSD